MSHQIKRTLNEKSSASQQKQLIKVDVTNTDSPRSKQRPASSDSQGVSMTDIESPSPLERQTSKDREAMRLERQAVSKSLALRKRLDQLEQLSKIDEANRSLEEMQMKQLSKFHRRLKGVKEFKGLSKTPRDHPFVMSLPPLVRDRLEVHDRTVSIKQMVEEVLHKNKGQKPKIRLAN